MLIQGQARQCFVPTEKTELEDTPGPWLSGTVRVPPERTRPAFPQPLRARDGVLGCGQCRADAQLCQKGLPVGPACRQEVVGTEPHGRTRRA